MGSRRAVPGRQHVAWVAHEEPAPTILVAVFEVTTLTLEEARQAELAHPTVVVAPFTIHERGDGLELLRAVAPRARTVLRCDFSELPDVVKAGAAQFVTKVVPRRVGKGLARSIRDALATLGRPASLSRPLPPPNVDFQSAVDLLERTVETLAELPGVIVRNVPPNEMDVHIEIVVPITPEYDAWHCGLPRLWNWPLKERHQDRRGLTHPVMRLLGGLAHDQEVYAKPVGSATSEDSVFAAVLPWRTKKRVTILLGLAMSRFDAAHRDVMRAVHDHAVASIPEFVLPVMPVLEPDGLKVHFIPEYAWFVTQHYAGPDRRTKETALVNRYMLFGRRVHLPPFLQGFGGFVDRMTPYVFLCTVLYVLLALADTALTWRFIRHGTLRELNPIMRPLLAKSPWLFVLVKNAMSTSLIVFVTRFQLFRFGRVAVTLNVVGYAALVAYWIVLLAR